MAAVVRHDGYQSGEDAVDVVMGREQDGQVKPKLMEVKIESQQIYRN